MPSEAQLRKLATLTVRSGLGLMPGQDLIVSADVCDAPFARLMAEEAYKAGARTVIMQYVDDLATLIRFQHGSDDAIAYLPKWLPEATGKALMDGTGFVRIYGSDPSLLKDIAPDKIAISSKVQSEAGRTISEAITGSYCNWCIMPVATPGWAKFVFPDLSAEEGVEKLWEEIFRTTRADQPDPVAAWNAHCDEIRRRMDAMNAAQYKAIHFKGPGTDLTVGLAEGNLWEGGVMNCKNGAVSSPNIPTEEIFSMPHRDRVDGTVSSTKPLSLRGQIVDGIQVTFKDGRAVEARAEKGQETLEKLLETDEGARHLGEIALVPHSSPISKSGLTFFNTLYDENASCHIALGRCIGSTMKDFDKLSEKERLAKGGNDSLVHVDWMIGSDKVDVDGIGADGSRTPVMRGCEWV
jgi:aminopeptidase